MMAMQLADPIHLGREAKRFSRELIKNEHRGPGDTIEGAADRIGRRNGIDPNILIQGWKKEPREWLASRWVALFLVHYREIVEAAETRAKQGYEARRAEADVERHPALVRLADLVAGRPAEPVEEEQARLNRDTE